MKKLGGLVVWLMMMGAMPAWAATPYPALYAIVSDLSQRAQPPFSFFTPAVCNMLYMVPWDNPVNQCVGNKNPYLCCTGVGTGNNCPTGVESTKGTFTWTDATNAIANFKATCPNGKYALGVVAGVHTPQWVYNDGAQSFTSVSGNVVPLPWDTVAQNDWTPVLSSAKSLFGSDTALDHVDMIGFANNTFPSSTLPLYVTSTTLKTITESGNTSTITTPSSVSISFVGIVNVGDTIVVSGNSVAGYNGTWTVATVNALQNIITFTNSTSGLGTGTGGTVCDTTLSPTCASDLSQWQNLSPQYTTVPLMKTALLNYGNQNAAYFNSFVFAPQPQGFPQVTGCGLPDPPFTTSSSCSSTNQGQEFINIAGTNWGSKWVFEADSLSANGADSRLPQAKAQYPNIRLDYQETSAQGGTNCSTGTQVNQAIALAQTNGANIVELYTTDIPCVKPPASGQPHRWPRIAWNWLTSLFAS